VDLFICAKDLFVEASWAFNSTSDTCVFRIFARHEVRGWLYLISALRRESLFNVVLG